MLNPNNFPMTEGLHQLPGSSFDDFNSPHRVVSIRRNHYLNEHADSIVTKLEEDANLMEYTPIAEQLRKEALRHLPHSLTMKRCVKDKLTISVSQKSKRKPIGLWKRINYQTNIRLTKLLNNVKTFNNLELWHNTLRDIEGRYGSAYASYFKFLRWLFIMNSLVGIISFSLLVVPQIIYDSTINTTRQNFEFQNILLGDRFLEKSLFYYSHYTASSFELIPSLFFHMPSAYFSVLVVLYLVQFFVLAISVAQLYRRTYIETEGGLQNVYANRIFCGWDFGIATKEAANLKSASIYYDLKELLSEERKIRNYRNCLVRFWTLSIQIIVNILIVGIITATAWLIWSLLENYSKDSKFVAPIVINLIVMIIPSTFTYISRYEDYKNPRVALYITMLRTYFLGAVILGTVLTFWLRQSTNDCWEDALASEIYRLIIFDFMFSVIFTLFINISIFIIRYFLNCDPKTEFNVAKNTLQIIYNQCLFWLGFYYSPLLSIPVTIKMLIIWYIQILSVKKLYRPPKRIWKAAQAQTWFMITIFISILLIIAAHGYSLKSVHCSSNCGAFKNYNYTYEIVTTSMDYLTQYTFWRFISNAFKPGGIAVIMIALIIFIYYLQKQANATKEKVKMLRETLIWLSKDKQYLNELYSNLSKNDYSHCDDLSRFKKYS